jgi:FMN phosphatase YigB (HAD superfamily)
MAKIIFWDWTGTLADEARLDKAVCLSLEENIAAKRGISFAEAEQLFKDHLKGIENSWKWHDYVQHGKHFGIDWKHSQEINLDKLALVPHARDILEHAKAKAYLNVLVTNAVRDVVLLRVKRAGLWDAFAAVIGSSDVQALKAEGKHFEHGLERLNGNPRQSYSVGDNPIQDILSAQKLGLKTVFCEFGKKLVHYHSEHISENHKERIAADHRIKNLMDLKNIIS